MEDGQQHRERAHDRQPEDPEPTLAGSRPRHTAHMLADRYRLVASITYPAAAAGSSQDSPASRRTSSTTAPVSGSRSRWSTAQRAPTVTGLSTPSTTATTRSSTTLAYAAATAPSSIASSRPVHGYSGRGLDHSALRRSPLARPGGSVRRQWLRASMMPT